MPDLMPVAPSRQRPESGVELSVGKLFGRRLPEAASRLHGPVIAPRAAGGLFMSNGGFVREMVFDACVTKSGWSAASSGRPEIDP